MTGVTPDITSDKSKLSGNIIVLSTKENNSLLKTNELDNLFESYMIRTVDKPFAKVASALVVTGSDALGTVYGAFNISEMIGVSPLYWWCDVEPKTQSEIILTNCDVDPKEPTVRYRGIFINDEEAMINWSRLTSEDKTKGAISPETYKRVFELMLRLKANTLWPSMMEAGSYFFEFKDESGVAINPKNATDYGIYIGSSHCENMACNNYAEWYEWAAEHK